MKCLVKSPTSMFGQVVDLPAPPMTRAEAWRMWDRYKEQAHALRARAERLARRIMDEARAEGNAAGVDGTILPIHLHNAFVSLHYGHPWPEVDYRRLRRARFLMEKADKPGRLVDAYLERKWNEVIEALRAADAEAAR